MHVIRVQHSLSSGKAEPRVVLGTDSAQRAFVGVSRGEPPEVRAFVFVQVDRVTAAELERGRVDLRTLMEERCCGLVVRACGEGDPDEVMTGVVVDLGANTASYRVPAPAAVPAPVVAAAPASRTSRIPTSV
jgi:hypothetical protein